MAYIKNPLTIIVNNGGGGGGGEIGKGQYFVQVIDYDGTILKSDNLNTGDIFTLPDIPTHSNLTFQSWSSPVTITDNTIIIENSDITIGATYTTVSGLSEFDIELTKVTGLSVTFNMIGNKNWGDGSTDSATTHTYTEYGKYTITCDGTTMSASSSAGLFGQNSSSINYTLSNVRLSSSVTSIGDYAFGYCSSLESITIPNSVTSIGYRIFAYCYSLTSITIPNSVTSSIGSFMFNSCYNLKSITIPNSIKFIQADAFQACYALTSITIPNSITSITSEAFAYCYNLKKLTIPDNLTKIDTNTFNGCYNLRNVIIGKNITTINANSFPNCYSIIKYDFSKSTSIPKLANTNAFTKINGICKIIVPDDLYDNWIIATNWITYANYIYKASEVN